METDEVWRSRSGAALARAEERARRDDERIACGFTNNVDRVIALDGAAFAALAREVGADGAALPPSGVVTTPVSLVCGLRWFLERGAGGEFTLADEAMAAWVASRFAGRRQLGGTGAQAAQTLARLGFRSLLHLTGRSRIQIEPIDDSGLVTVATPRRLRTPAEAVRPEDPTPIHFIFEYEAGLIVPFADRTLATTQANRVIVPYNPINARLPLDPCFFTAVADPANRVRRVLVSGYNQIPDRATASARIATTVAAIDAWRRARPGLIVHLELAATPEPSVLGAILDELAPHVDSVGLNADELDTVLAMWGESPAHGIDEVLDGLTALHRRLGRPRVGLHTQDYCLSLTRVDPTAERDALRYAALVAGTRARIGAFPTPSDLRATLDDATPSTAGVAFIQRLADLVGLKDGIARYGSGWLVAVPTFALAAPVGTVGLGDSFTAGLLAML